MTKYKLALSTTLIETSLEGSIMLPNPYLGQTYTYNPTVLELTKTLVAAVDHRYNYFSSKLQALDNLNTICVVQVSCMLREPSSDT